MTQVLFVFLYPKLFLILLHSQRILSMDIEFMVDIFFFQYLKDIVSSPSGIHGFK